MSKKAGKKKKGKSSPLRKISRITAAFAVVISLALASAGDWYVHHSRSWRSYAKQEYPAFITGILTAWGEPTGDLTDALGWTGHDAIYEYDEAAPNGAVSFAGDPRRIDAPAPNDIITLDRGEFHIGWSPSLRHPVWVTYHVTAKANYPSEYRPNFSNDRSAPRSPNSGDYKSSGYDRGHMAPNYAIVTRYGQDMQKQTFKMSNIAPQKPALNRGVWRDLEHRIAELWTSAYGEIWVTVGCISSGRHGETITGTDIDVPNHFYQVIVAQEGMNVRAMAVLLDQDTPWGSYPTAGLITIDELEKLTGLDFLPELPGFIQDPLEAELPSRLWPIKAIDIFKLIRSRFYN